MSALKGIVVGLGGRGLHWVRAGDAHPDIELVGFVEPAEANRQRAVERGVDAQKIALSLDEALTRFDAQFVLDITPPSAHVPIARGCMSWARSRSPMTSRWRGRLSRRAPRRAGCT